MTIKMKVRLKVSIALDAKGRSLLTFYLDAMGVRVDMVVKHCSTIAADLTSFAVLIKPGCFLLTLFTLTLRDLIRKDCRFLPR